jgi:Flp pilus assembly pilin Flp
MTEEVMHTFEMAVLVAWTVAASVGGRCQAWLARAPRAQSTVEYALIGALIVVIASVAVGTLGTQVTTVFENMAKALQSAGGK